MDAYSHERWMLERHQAMIRAAEARSRLLGARRAERVSPWLAVQLRRLADRLEGDQQLETASQ